MSAKLRKIRANAERVRVAVVQTPARRSKDILAEWMVKQKEYSKMRWAAKGRFSSSYELISYLSDELPKGRRTRVAIAEDAQIPVTTLYYLVRSGQVPRAPVRDASKAA